MDQLRRRLLHLLAETLPSVSLLAERLDQEARANGGEVYAMLLTILTGVELTAEEAGRHWKNILFHHRFMSERLGRSVSLQTALCDYFTTVSGRLHNVKLVDMQQYESTLSQARTDHLTGLYNRWVFNELFSREVSLAQRHGWDLSLLFFDLDDFKNVNDRYGHLAGDEVLRQVACVFLASRRNEDIVARWGGEEIVVLLPHTGKQQALAMGERFRRRIAELRIPFDGQELRVTVSGGLASFPFDAAGPESLQRDADLAMYHAKIRGKNQICLFSSSMRRYARAPLETEVTVRDLSGNGRPPMTGRCRNISGGGLLLENPHPLATGSLVETRLALADAPPLALAGRVVYCRPQRSGTFETGLAVIDLDHRAALAISSFLLGRSLDTAH